MSGPRRPAARARVDRVPDAGLGVGVLAADVEVAQARPGREGGDGHRLDGGERVALEQDPVLERARLGFVRVAHEVVRLRRLGRDGGPLAAGREGRPAATHQLRGGDLVDDGLGTDLEGAGEGRIAAMRPIVVERQSGRRDRPGGAAAATRRPRSAAPPCRPMTGRPVRGRRSTPTASTGAMTDVLDASPARVTIAAGARSHSPRHGLRIQAARPSPTGSPAGATPRARSSQIRSAPARRQAMSSQTWATTGGRGVVAKSA